MKEIDIDGLVNANYRMCTLLGIATAIICAKDQSKVDKEWFMDAIQKVIYENKPLPPMP